MSDDNTRRDVIEGLLVAAKGWTHPDDWDRPVITFGVLEAVAEALIDGDSPMGLRRHAKHVRIEDCVRSRCDVTCYSYIMRSRRHPSEESWVTRFRQSVEGRGLTFGEGRQ